MIFGPGGKNYQKSGDTVFGPNGSIHRRSGNTMFTSDGDTLRQSGNMTFCKHGQIMRTGFTWHASSGQYRLSGRTLYGPGGKIWHNVDASDVEMLIHDDM